MAVPLQTYTLEDCKKHTTEDSCWLIIHGKVYDVTEFLDEHPGGYDIVLTNTGKDSTEDFDEIGHSNAAQEMLHKYLIGEVEGGTVPPPKSSHKVTLQKTSNGGSTAMLKALLPLLVIVAALLYNTYLRK